MSVKNTSRKDIYSSVKGDDCFIDGMLLHGGNNNYLYSGDYLTAGKDDDMLVKNKEKLLCSLPKL